MVQVRLALLAAAFFCGTTQAQTYEPVADWLKVPAGRETLLWECARAVWLYFVQREACGLRSHDHPIEVYGIPREVLVRVGGAPPSTAPTWEAR